MVAQNFNHIKNNLKFLFFNNKFLYTIIGDRGKSNFYSGDETMYIDQTLTGNCTLKSNLISNIISEPLSEKAILELQDIFLTNGIHYIKLTDVSSDKKIITKIIKSLNCYKNIGYLTKSKNFEDKTFFNLYKIITAKNKESELMNFLLNDFICDFLLIELLFENDFINFKKYLLEFGFDKLMPIIILENRI